MARKTKSLIQNGVDKRETGYYSTPDFVAHYIGEQLLRATPNGSIALDPAIGNGELVHNFLTEGKKVVGFDIIDHSGQSKPFHFYNLDFIKFFLEHRNVLAKYHFDYIVLNPPYNCHEHSYISRNKDLLKTHFKTGVTNTFSLFLEAIIDISKTGCVIGAILPDSILFSVSYQELRIKLMRECEILQIILCPDDLFHHQIANVSTCILIFRKGGPTNGTIKISNRLKSSSSFRILLKRPIFQEVKIEDLLLSVNRDNTIFSLDVPPEICALFKSNKRLGTLFKCGGGVSTGNDSEHTSPNLCDEYAIPYFRNVTAHFVAEPKTYLRTDFRQAARGVRNFIIRNNDFVESEGIVCSGIGKHFFAAYLPKYGVTGVNAAIWPNKEDIYWLLAYLNSSIVVYILKGILARGNMTTIGSVSSLPLIDLNDSVKKSLSRISNNVLNGKIGAEDAIAKIDKIVFKNLELPLRTRRKILQFCSDLTHLV